MEINRAALARNLAICSKQAGNKPVLAMIKADGYGHGMIECAQVFAQAGAAAFGVAEPVEGVRLRQAGFEQDIFLLAGIYKNMADEIVRHRLTPVLLDASLVEEFSSCGEKAESPVRVFVKIDAGMGRQGCLEKEATELLKKVKTLPGVELGGIIAHLPMADDPASQTTGKILDRYKRITAELTQQNCTCILSLANSGGLFHFPATCFDMVRPGISLYGYYPNGREGMQRAIGEKLQPAMRFVSRISQLREVPTGTGLGYGHTFVTNRPTKLAVLPAGYEDGYLRTLSNKAAVLVQGKRAPVIGRISMNLTMVDVTDLPNVAAGDGVVLLGRQGKEEISADDIAAWMGTISYEVLCLFGSLNDRYYIN